MPQDIALTPTPINTDPPLLAPEQIQEAQTRWQYLLNQMNQMRGSTRILQVNIVLANMNDELTKEFKAELRAQLLQMAATLEVSE